MQAYKPDRVVKVLSALATGVYWLAWGFVVLALVAIPVAAMLAGRGGARSYDVTLSADGAVTSAPGGPLRVSAPVTLARPGITLPAWRGKGARVDVTEVRATASVPMSSLSAAVVALVWLTVAGFFALLLLFLRELRRLFQRLREGAPFDPSNVTRLRRLGFLLLAAGLWKGASDFWMSLTISRMVEGPGDALGTGLNLNMAVLFVSLVLIALAEIFRRGAALEDEQALVV